MGKEMKEYIVKLSPIVKEEELIAMGFVKSLGKFFGGFEEKKGVQVCLAIDFETKLMWITANNDNVVPPDSMVMGGEYHEDGEVVMLEREVQKTYEFDLGFEIPQVLLQMMMHGLVHIEKKEGN